MRVLCLVPLPTIGASNRLRVEQYGPVVRPRGIELTVSAFFDDAAASVLYEPGRERAKALGVLAGLARRVRDLARSGGYDLILVHRESAAIGPPLVEPALRAAGRPYVFDFDDAIFLRPVHPVNRRWAWLRDPSRVAWTTRHAAGVIAGNGYLAEWARALNPNVTVIPTPVDTDRHRPREGPRPAGPVVIGWVGSSTTAPYLRLLDEALALLSDRVDVVVRVVGGRYSHPRVPVDERPYRLGAEPDDLRSFDIGVLPEPDDAWTRGKGAFKALLYMATGLPVVASRVGVNPDVVAHGENGFCVDGALDWAEHLERLVRDADLRARMGLRGRERAERLYSLRALAPRFAEALEGAVARGGRH